MPAMQHGSRRTLSEQRRAVFSCAVVAPLGRLVIARAPGDGRSPLSAGLKLVMQTGGQWWRCGGRDLLAGHHLCLLPPSQTPHSSLKWHILASEKAAWRGSATGAYYGRARASEGRNITKP